MIKAAEICSLTGLNVGFTFLKQRPSVSFFFIVGPLYWCLSQLPYVVRKVKFGTDLLFAVAW